MNSPERFWDFSTLHKNHPLYDTSFKNDLGLFKLETADFISGFVGPRPKVYSVETIPYEEFMKLIKNGPICVKKYLKKNIKRLKGVKKEIIRQYFTHDIFKSAVLSRTISQVSYFTISSRRHNVTTDLKAKLGLSRYAYSYLCIKISNSKEGIYNISIFIYSFYDKRFVHRCRIHTTPLNHFRLKNKNYDCIKCEKFGGYVDKCV